jgi:hypothetical protein
LSAPGVDKIQKGAGLTQTFLLKIENEKYFSAKLEVA